MQDLPPMSVFINYPFCVNYSSFQYRTNVLHKISLDKEELRVGNGVSWALDGDGYGLGGWGDRAINKSRKIEAYKGKALFVHAIVESCFWWVSQW